VTSLNPSHQPAGWGAYAIRALPDLCRGMVLDIFLDALKPRHARGFLLLCVSAATSPGGRAVSFARRLRYFFRRQRETLVERVVPNAPPPFHMRS